MADDRTSGDWGATAAGGPRGVRRRNVRRATSRAQEYLREPQKLVRLMEDAARKSDSAEDGPAEELKALVRLGLAYTRGEYRQIPRDKLVKAVAAIAYFVSPIDIIPDVFGILGLSDDALVLAFFTRMIREEIDRFLTWEADHANLPAAEVIEVIANGHARPPSP